MAQATVYLSGSSPDITVRCSACNAASKFDKYADALKAAKQHNTEYHPRNS